LQPTPETRLAYIQRTRRQQAWGWGTTAVGTGVAAAAAVFVVLNQKGLDDARKSRDAVDAKFLPKAICDTAGEGYPPEPGQALSGHDRCDKERSDAYDKVNDRELRRTIGLVTLGVGAAGMVAGAILLLTNDSPHKYDHPESELALTPLGWVDGGGLHVGFRARF
jgi:hypothetical protein